MNNKGSVLFAIFIATLTFLPMASHETARAGDAGYVAAAEPDQSGAKSWNPLTRAKRATGKLASAVASGARKITKGITGKVTGLFGGEDGADSKQASEPAAGQIEGKDQLGGSLETHSAVPAKPDGATVQQSNTAAAPDIETKELASLSKTESSLTAPTARCERAKVTVSKYAFADIEPISCTGDVYRFSASREGDKFVIKIRALNGELLEVEKLKPSSGSPKDSQQIANPQNLAR